MILLQLLLHLGVRVCVCVSQRLTLSSEIRPTTTSSLRCLFLFLFPHFRFTVGEITGASIEVVVRRSLSIFCCYPLPSSSFFFLSSKYYHTISMHAMTNESVKRARKEEREEKKKRHAAFDSDLYFLLLLHVAVFFICNFRFSVRAQCKLSHIHTHTSHPVFPCLNKFAHFIFMHV